ncbi:signal peptidase II [Chloroflexota bacterium]
MYKSDPLQGKWRDMVFSLIALMVIAADQLTKIWIRSNLDTGESLPEAGLFRLTRVHNTGAAFGLFQDQSFLLSIVALIGIVFLLLFVFLSYRYFPFLGNRLGKPALGLVLGGTAGNLIDRLRLGYVTDFIDIGIWPAFNIADSAIVVGIIIFAYSLLSSARAENTDLSP